MGGDEELKEQVGERRSGRRVLSLSFSVGKCLHASLKGGKMC